MKKRFTGNLIVKRTWSMMLALSAVVALSACGGGSASAPTTAAQTTLAEGGSGQETAAPESGDEEDKYGGTITLPVAADVSTLLAWKMRTSAEDIIAPILYENLFKLDENGIPQPWLLESYEADKENMAYVLKVKSGVTFHDGSVLDAEALRWNVQKYLEDGILASSYYSNVESVEATDDETVVIHMSNWDSLLPYAMTRSLLITSQKAFEEGGEEGLAQKPVGTGPFQYDSWDFGQEIHFKRYDGYWQGKPYLDGVDVAIYEETLVSEAALQIGDLDVMMSVGFDTADTMEQNGFTVTKSVVPSKAFTLMYASNFDGPMKDVKVRQAVSHAVNGQEIIDALCGDYAVVSNQWSLPGNVQYNEQIAGFDYDPEKAKQLLAEAGYPDGFSITLTTRSYDLEMDVCQILIEQLGAVGITVNFNPCEPANYSSTYLPSFEGLLMHPMNVYNGQWSQTSACCKQGVTTGLGAQSFIHPDDTNEALTQAAASDEDETKALFDEAERLIFEEHCMFKPIFITYDITVINPKLHDSNINYIAPNTNTLYKAWLEK